MHTLQTKTQKKTFAWSFMIAVILPLCIQLLLTGCTMARMAVPRSLTEQTPEMPVLGKKFFTFDESFHFGNYEVFDVHRSWTRSREWGISGFYAAFSSAKREQEYEFSVRHPDNTIWDCACATNVKQKEFEYTQFFGGSLEIELLSKTLFLGTYKPRHANTFWKLVMSQTTGEIVMDGVVSDGQTYIYIKGTQKLAASSLPLMDPTGYYFYREGILIGAVDVLNDGAVWILPSERPETRAVMGSTAAALLLFKNIKK